MRGQQT